MVVLCPSGLYGLSPRVRGNPDSRSPSVCPCPVYPRECGGTIAGVHVSMSGRGLSPRVRGNRTEGRNGISSGRSIPASAGEPLYATCGRRRAAVYPRECGGTSRSLRSRLRNTVYPRECGGTDLMFSVFGTFAGLSPRVRGNPPPRFLEVVH